MFGAAFVAVLASCTGLVIPLVLKWIVDGPVAERDTGGVWLGGALLLAVGVLEAGLFGLRRWLNARPLASVEAAMRAAIYRHLQRLPVSFHDRWPSGQLLSRATTDLQLLRMFLAFGVTYLLVNGVTIAVGCAISCPSSGPWAWSSWDRSSRWCGCARSSSSGTRSRRARHRTRSGI